MNTLYYIAKLCYSTLFVLLCLNTLEATAQGYEVEPAPFNGQGADFGVVKFHNGVVFCSDRTRKKLSADEDSVLFYTDMFQSKLLPNNQWTAPELFSPVLTDFLNEGPAAFTQDNKTVYFTSNFAPKDTTRRGVIEEYKLGIFSSRFINGSWTPRVALPYNSSKSDYNLAHPALSPNDSVLYFASNMPGGLGGSDIYKCIWKNDRWSLPINLGADVNSSHDEYFPFHTTDGALYFTSNRPTEGKGDDLNIFAIQITEFGFGRAGLLPAPLNSEYDDFAYSEYMGNQFGFFSSNRNKTSDDIYQFRLNAPNFNDCQENSRPIYCYQIEDTRITETDSLPLVYEWNLGDGNFARGLSIQHCYDSLGTFHVSLTIKDTITNTVFYEVSSTDIEIAAAHQPYIICNDSTLTDIPTKFYSDYHFITDFKIENRYWIVDNKHHFEGDSLTYTFTETGTHTVVCGVTGPIGSNGQKQKACSYRQIQVFEPGTPNLPSPHPDPKEKPMQHIRLKSNFDMIAQKNSPELAPLFHIVLAQSKQRITFNDPFFSKNRFVIIESQETDGSYTYSVGNTAEINRLFPLFKELQDSGYTDLKVETYNRQEMVKEFVRTGKFIQKGNADELNKEFANLRDIKFEYNSDIILEESKANLNYIAAMLQLESDFSLKIAAHTCSQGTHDYNQSLSVRRAASVLRYFKEKGIDTSRITSQGYAETMPIATNLTEEGRAMNRRVEFVIVFESHVLASNEK